MTRKDVLNRLSGLSGAGKYQEVIKIAESMLYEDSDDPVALFYLATALANTGHEETAYILQKHAVQLRPDKAEMWQNMGHIADKIWRYDEALYCYSEAITRDPLAHENYASMASSLVGLGKYAMAKQYAERALELNPDSPMGKINLGFAHLHLGNWKEGWKGYHELLGHPSQRRKHTVYGRKQVWNRDPNDKLVVYTEQGIGDGIMFASCIPDLLLDQSGPVVIDCDKKLEGLFRRSFPTCEVHGTRHDDAPAWLPGSGVDASVAIGTLPMWYRTHDDDFPRKPYLVADMTRRAGYRAILDTFGPGLKVGISWHGGTSLGGLRRLEMDRLDDLIKSFPDIVWVSLNYKDMPEQPGVHVLPFATQTNDYDDTAAMVAELDLVISVPQAVVHLAGALGTPCWCLAPDVTRWIYGTEGEKHPWYGSVRIFRGWDTMTEQVKEALHGQC